MTPNEYQELAQRTDGTTTTTDKLTNGCFGLAGESGEFIDMVKKHFFHGHTLDGAKCQKELGDCLWYIAQLCSALGLTLEEVMIANIEKLKKRYPEGFSSEASINRKE
jgi:NTP pyrophosphatase (non-canonical NTP hydrolase)